MGKTRDDGSALRGDTSASRSRSRSTSTTRQQQDERNPNQGKKKNKKTKKGRRRARAQSITKTYQNRKNAAYVDAATYVNGKDAVVTMIDAQLKEKVSASLKNCTVSDAEEAAVALTVAEGNRSGQSLVIITDSQDACRGYTNGRADESDSDKPIFEVIFSIWDDWVYWGIILPMGIGLITSSFVVLPSMEICNEARELQLMTGLSGCFYLGTHFLFDLLFYLVPLTTIYFGFTMAFNLSGSTQ
ncbi:hypothetical protein MTO96_033906, partial [Rhipicephalus appendiculatus]